MVGGTVTHQHQGLIFRQMLEFPGDGLDDFLVVIGCGQERCAESERVEAVLESQGFLFHPVVLDTVDHMGRLDDHVCDLVPVHLLHGLGHVVDVDLIPLPDLF